MVAVAIVNVPLFIILIVPVTFLGLGIVKLMVCTPSPTCTTEPAPLTVQFALIVGAALFTIIKVLPGKAKLRGDNPLPLVAVPQVAKVFKFPAALE